MIDSALIVLPPFYFLLVGVFYNFRQKFVESKLFFDAVGYSIAIISITILVWG